MQSTHAATSLGVVLAIAASLGCERAGSGGGPAAGTAFSSSAANPTKFFHAETGLTFVRVEAGELSVEVSRPGSRPPPADAPVHQLRVDRPFLISTTEVTVGQWREFVDSTGYVTTAELTHAGKVIGPECRILDAPNANWRQPFVASGTKQTSSEPVVQVSYADARTFCRHNGFRLPTEAEWEWAARAGCTSAYWWGILPRDGEGRGNFNDAPWDRVCGGWEGFPFDDGFERTSPVGHFAPNPWGLHDILGNVWEWCQPSESSRSLFFADQPEGSWGVGRGGAWLSGPDFARITRSAPEPAGFCSDTFGFRVVTDVP